MSNENERLCGCEIERTGECDCPVTCEACWGDLAKDFVDVERPAGE